MYMLLDTVAAPHPEGGGGRGGGRGDRVRIFVRERQSAPQEAVPTGKRRHFVFGKSRLPRALMLLSTLRFQAATERPPSSSG